MRDPNRIDYYCDEFAELWHKVPDWRMSQFMVNIMLAYHNKFGRDAFYVEDPEFMEFIKSFIKEATNARPD